MSQCHDGWNSTSSIRLPLASWVCRTGELVSARRPWSWASAVPARRPSASSSATPAAETHRRAASASAGSVPKKSYPPKGGAWFVTSCVLTCLRLGGAAPAGTWSHRRFGVGPGTPESPDSLDAMTVKDRLRDVLERVPGAMAQLGFVRYLYWPAVVVFGALALTTLYHVSTPRRGPFWRNNVRKGRDPSAERSA
jgi:hypothetical protein